MQGAGDLSRPEGLLEAVLGQLGRTELFTVTVNEDADLRQYARMLQQLTGFAAAVGHAPGRVSPAETLQAAGAASQILRCFLKPNSTGGIPGICVPTTASDRERCMAAGSFAQKQHTR